MGARTRTTVRPTTPAAAGPSTPTLMGPPVITTAGDTDPTPTLESEVDSIVLDVGTYVGQVLTKRIQAYVRTLQVEASDAEKLKAEVARLASELQTAGHNESFLKLQLQAVRNDLEKVKTEVSEVWKAKVSKLTSQLESADRSKAKLRQSIADLHKKLANAKQEAAQEVTAKLQAEELANWENKERAWQAESASMKKEVNDMKEEIAETATIRQQLASLQEDLQCKEQSAARFKSALDVQ
ncbi:hypothetical protein R1sor_001632 [Riccia sorocarpa]|uniref:Uncharacterized protein n=1 Tax=Riccia sorocarpa TaxID=122646 RepID=A0ABD3GWH4_9MARC